MKTSTTMSPLSPTHRTPGLDGACKLGESHNLRRFAPQEALFASLTLRARLRLLPPLRYGSYSNLLRLCDEKASMPSARYPNITPHACCTHRAGPTKKAVAENCYGLSLEMVRQEGLEPSHLSAPEPKSGVSTNSTTGAMGRYSSRVSGNCQRGFPAVSALENPV